MDIDMDINVGPYIIKYICINCCEARHEKEYYYYEKLITRDKTCIYCRNSYKNNNKVEMKRRKII